MAIEYRTTMDDKVLRSIAWGFDETLEQSTDYGINLVKTAIENNCEYAICDERDLEYRLSVLDTFKLADTLSKMAPRLGKVAIVCREQDLDNAVFYENVATNRGCTIKVFTDMMQAETWIKNAMASAQTQAHQP